MVKATQLRLNNTLSFQGRAGRVVRLDHEGITIEFEDGDISDVVSESQLEGVALAPELLQRAGFEFTGHTNAYQFVLNEDAIITVNPHIQGGYSVQLCIQSNWCGKPIQTLHELQNIYIDLTGDELTTD